ncbi:MAG: PAS domain S-box protein [Planctomycetota bacterium]
MNKKRTDGRSETAAVALLKHAEEALRESETRYRNLFEQSGDYIMVMEVGPDGIPVIVDANMAALRAHGYLRKELVGKPIGFLDSGSTANNHRRRIRKVVGGDISLFEVQHRRKDGSTFDVEVRAQTVKIGSSRFVLTSERDITERKQLNARIQAFSREILIAREQERKRVSSILHHDVGSLAIGISAYFDRIESDIRSGTAGSTLTSLKMVRKLFEQSVVRLKRVATELRPPDLDILGLGAAMRQHFSLIMKRSAIRIHFRENLARKRLPATAATVLFRVVQEALTNAITHGQAKKVNVRLNRLKKDVRLTVKDDGKGFDPFTQVRRPLHMGICVMREMVVFQGGIFKIDSAPGKGAIVSVMLPFEAAALGQV